MTHADPAQASLVCLIDRLLSLTALVSGLYDKLSQPQNIAAFAVVYGLFLSFGEAGPGNCIGLLASKSSPTGFRGQYYGLAAAIGKIGAFAGTWVRHGFTATRR